MEDGQCPYGLLGVEQTASDAEIRRAFKKRALQLHPDKNPDNPNAAALFMELCEANAILTDSKAKALYDLKLAQKSAAKQRTSQLDAATRKAKEDLERREQAAKRHKTGVDDTAAQFDKELKRLRADGKRRMQEEGDRVLREEEANMRESVRVIDATVVQIRWNPAAATFTAETLRALLATYGTVDVVSSTPGKALASFSRLGDAEGAIRGERDGALTLSLKASTAATTACTSTTAADRTFTADGGAGQAASVNAPAAAVTEDSILARMRYAALRQAALKTT